ncbi:aminotransferase [Sphingomonas sp. AP4-R1]|uniref:aminotransferase n=1 Tax=Sphingomonas sp. AP4-R1 TaxID=2735134 RepID=UPI001493456C|nr:aminotransferase [Sphingomonas sp. AP4-R1]QJU58134.1 aminotransferase [Sphingomonas sp. AP4-R1]
MNPIYAAMGTTIFEEISARARETGAINLGQGFPEEDGFPAVRQAAAEALIARSNQYPPMMGLPELRAAVAAHYAAHQNLPARASDVLVTSGATEALAAALLALIAPGDEVLLIQPLYDAYLPLVRRAGGIAKLVTMAPPDWALPREALRAAIGPRTRLLLLNNPVNPLGKALDADELAFLAELCVAHDLVAICDEVWEHVVFDGRRHIPLIGLPGMAERTVKIGSAGKIFSLTGWKVGFVLACPALLTPITRAHQFLTFTTPPTLQIAVAAGLASPEPAFAAMRDGYQRSRDRLAAALAAGGYAVLPSGGTYFLTINLSASGLDESDRDFCARIVRDHGVAAIPLSAFYAEDAPDTFVRLCFAKSDATLDEAARRLVAARSVARAPQAAARDIA